MLKILPKTKHQLAVCEANYLRLKKILESFSKDCYLIETVNPNQSSNPIEFKVIDRSMHTLIIEAKQIDGSKNLDSFVMRIQVCLDVKLAEVISFQGERPVPYFIKKIETQSKDEKIQQNRFLTEWLESIFLTGINPRIKF